MTAIAFNGIAELSQATARMSRTLSGPLDSPSTAIRRVLGASQNLTVKLQDAAAALDALHRERPGEELDSEECFEKQLLDVQADIRELWECIAAIRAALPFWRHPMAKIGAFALSTQFRRQFELLERMRTLVKQHDADASPRSAAFSDHESLMRHLRGN